MKIIITTHFMSGFMLLINLLHANPKPVTAAVTLRIYKNLILIRPISDHEMVCFMLPNNTIINLINKK